MTILAIDDNPESLGELADTLQTVFPQETIVAFGSPLFALQYACNHPKEIGLVFSAMTMRRMDGITLAQSIKNYAPGAAIFFMVQTENVELAEIAKQHGNGTCLPRPITVERIQQATSFLQEPCPWEDENCEEGGCGNGATTENVKHSFKKGQYLIRRKKICKNTRNSAHESFR